MERVWNKRSRHADMFERFLDVHFPPGHDRFEEIGVALNADGQGVEVWARQGDARVSAGLTWVEFLAHEHVDGIRAAMEKQIEAHKE